MKLPSGPRQTPPRSSRPARRWVCLVEQVLGGWAPTLRAAVLILVTGGCLLALAAATFGVPGAAAYLVGFVVVRLLVPHRAARARSLF